jgi:hypothetical protein
VSAPKITIAVLYCEQPRALRRQVQAWGQYTPAQRAAVEFLVVDDCSPTPAAGVLVGCGLPVRVQRLGRAIPWNLGAGRNLAVYGSRAEAVLLLDIDQVLTTAQAQAALGLQVDPGTYLAPILRDARTGAALGPHPHTLLVRRDDFITTGGYDEAWHGYESDHLFKPRRDAMLRRLIDPQFKVDHHADMCTRWPRAGRHNARTRDTYAYGQAMQAAARPSAILTQPWHEVTL